MPICNQHRILGYTVRNNQWVCIGCGKPQSAHETIEQTLARREGKNA